MSLSPTHIPGAHDHIQTGVQTVGRAHFGFAMTICYCAARIGQYSSCKKEMGVAQNLFKNLTTSQLQCRKYIMKCEAQPSSLGYVYSTPNTSQCYDVNALLLFTVNK